MKLSLPIIADLFVIVVLVVSMLIGRKRGFVKTISGLLTIVIAISLASLVAKETTPVISEKYVFPYLTTAINDEITNTNHENTNTINIDALSDIFAKIGIPESVIESAFSDISKTLSQSFSAPLTAMTNNISFKMTYGILFIIYFLLALLLISLLFKILNLISKLPVLNFTNRLLGLIIGLISGYLIIVAITFIANKVGFILTDAVISETIILKHVINLSLISF